VPLEGTEGENWPFEARESFRFAGLLATAVPGSLCCAVLVDVEGAGRSSARGGSFEEVPLRESES